ncbi:MAG: hypothetical protein M3441_27115, partial [Chloroflexota bacterium]|nr:hypothetical protein [Chloroflexota bacterium]
VIRMKALGDKLKRWPRAHLSAKHVLDAPHPKLSTRQHLGAVGVARQHPSLPREMNRVLFPQMVQSRKWILLELDRGRVVNDL